MSERRYYCSADWFSTKSRMEGRGEMQSTEGNPTMPATTSASQFEEDADLKCNDSEILYGNNCSLSRLSSEQGTPPTEIHGDVRSSEHDLLDDDRGNISSFSPSVANSEEEQRNDSSCGRRIGESNQLLSSENPSLDIAFPYDKKEEMSVNPTTEPKSPKVHSGSAENVYKDWEESAAVKTTLSHTAEKNADSPQTSDICSEELHADCEVTEEIINIKQEEVLSKEEPYCPTKKRTETGIPNSEGDTTKACTETTEVLEEVGVQDVLNVSMEINGPEASQSKENTSNIVKEVETPLSKDDMGREVLSGSDIMEFEDISMDQSVLQLNNNNSSENLDACELFEGPIGYGTDLDDSPSMESVAYGCGICYCIVGYTRESFTRHQKKFHWISLQCKVCKKCFVTTKAYENHMTTHIRYPCLHCPKEFKHPLEVEDHQRQHFSNKLIRCERCGEEFYLLATLKQHNSFMGTKCVEIQKNVQRIQQQLASPLANKVQGKCSKSSASSSRVPKREMVEETETYSNRNNIPKPTVATRRSKRIKYEVKYEF